MKAVVPIDGADTSHKIAASVRRLLALQPTLEIHLVTVMAPTMVKGRTAHGIQEANATAIGLVAVRAPFPRIVESHGEAMERMATQCRNSLEHLSLTEFPGAACTVHAVWSEHPAAAINELAEAVDADVIAMATHSRSGVSHVLSGSVTEAVIRTATRPVLVQGPNAV